MKESWGLGRGWKEGPTYDLEGARKTYETPESELSPGESSLRSWILYPKMQRPQASFYPSLP